MFLTQSNFQVIFFQNLPYFEVFRPQKYADSRVAGWLSHFQVI